MKKLIVLAVLPLFLVGCSTYYGNVNYAEESSVYLKPSYRDSDQIGHYISGSVQTSLIENNNAYKGFTYGNFSYNKGITKENVNFAYGGFVYGGKINFTEANLEKYNVDPTTGIPTETSLVPEDFYFFGGGFSGEVEYNMPFDWVDWRIIGLKATLSYEESEYAEYRKAIVKKSDEVWVEENQEPFFSNDRAVNLNYDGFSFNVSGTSSLIFKMDKGDVGLIGSMGLGNQGVTTSGTLYYSENRITGFMSLHTGLQGALFRAGIAYRIK